MHAPEAVDSSSGRGGRGCGRWNSRDRTSNHKRHDNNRNAVHFTGREPLLQGHIYDTVGDHNADQYIKTTNEIAIFVGKKYTRYVSTFMDAVNNLELIDPVAPNDPDPTNVIELEVWKLAYKKTRHNLRHIRTFVQACIARSSDSVLTPSWIG